MRATRTPARRNARWIGPASLTAIAFSLSSPITSSEIAEAKTPGSTYCFYGTCHRVKTLAEMDALVGTSVTLTASHYDSCGRDRYNPCGLTSSGERFSPERPDNAASPIYPDGTTLLVWSPVNKAAVVLRVNNAGPYWGGRNLDVSRSTADRLGFSHRGVARLEVRIVDAPDRDEATYSRGRRYDSVPGYIGEFETLDAAEAGMKALMGLRAVASATLVPVADRISATPVSLAFNSPFEPGKRTGLDVAALETTSIAAAEAALEMDRVAASMTALVRPAEMPPGSTVVAALDSKALPQALALARPEPSETRAEEPRERRERSDERRERVEKATGTLRREPEVVARAAAPKPRQALANRQIALAEQRSAATVARRHNDRVAGPPNDHSVFSAHASPERASRSRLAGSAGNARRAQLRYGRPAA